MHYEMEEEEHVVYPDDPDFDINKARLFTTVPQNMSAMNVYPCASSSMSTRYTPYTQEGRLFEEKHRLRPS